VPSLEQKKMLKSKAQLKPYSTSGQSPNLVGKWSNELLSVMGG
jgi:hypothetical protein